MGWIAGFLRFCYDFVIGDCWQIAAGVALVLVAGATAARIGLLPPLAIGPCVLVGLVLVVLVGLLREARPRRS